MPRAGGDDGTVGEGGAGTAGKNYSLIGHDWKKGLSAETIKEEDGY